MKKHQKRSLLGPENKGLRTDQFTPVITEKRAVEKLKLVFLMIFQFCWIWQFLRRRAGDDLTWSTVPRKEWVIGFVDRRLTLKGGTLVN